MRIHHHLAVANRLQQVLLLCFFTQECIVLRYNFLDGTSLRKKLLQELYSSPQLSRPERTGQPLDSTFAIFSGKSTCILPLLKLPKDSTDVFIIR